MILEKISDKHYTQMDFYGDSTAQNGSFTLNARLRR
jgi:hypothetical protein